MQNHKTFGGIRGQNRSQGTVSNGKTALTLRIALHELVFSQPPTPTTTDNSEAKSIVADKVRPKSTKAMYMRFYWMKDRIK